MGIEGDHEVCDVCGGDGSEGNRCPSCYYDERPE